MSTLTSRDTWRSHSTLRATKVLVRCFMSLSTRLASLTSPAQPPSLRRRRRLEDVSCVLALQQVQAVPCVVCLWLGRQLGCLLLLVHGRPAGDAGPDAVPLEGAQRAVQHVELGLCCPPPAACLR